MAAGSSQVTVNVLKDHPAQVGNFGANGKGPQTAVTVNAAATDAATTMALANQLRAALIACGLCV